jgi:hypothetical protein
MTTYTVTVMDSDRRRRRPLARHAGLIFGEALTLAQIYRDGLGYEGRHVAVEEEVEEEKKVAQPTVGVSARRVS